jgi:MiaB/RimO family radical SAM methylthiotransferase
MPSIYFTPDDMCTTLKLEVKRIHDYFVTNHWTTTTNLEKADIVIVPTCVGWEILERNSLDRLREMNELGKEVIALGCLNHFNPAAVEKVHSGLCVPTQEIERIASLIPNPEVKFSDIPEPSTFRCKEDYRLYDLTKRFVNIAIGCSFSCSYCPHKIGLGPLKSRPLEDILAQVEDLVAGGVRIVVLTGMETSLYGRDIGTSYPHLLKKVMEIDSKFEIHIAQFSPAGIIKYHKELLPLFSNERVTDIQIPIQTTSDRILKLMHRPRGIKRISEFLKEIRNNNKRAVLRTDIIVGFPTETMEELNNTLRFVVDIFDEIAVYAIEIRAGLPAEKLIDKVHTPEEINRRIELATKYIEKRGKVAHGGQQVDPDLEELEKKREAIRKVRREAC